MRNTLPIFVCCLLGITAQAQTKFFDGNYHEALLAAQERGKYLFVDCYTDWCGWCKVADKKTFAAEDVGEFLNEHFVSVKVDMERGKGVRLGMKYRVASYPTYLIFSPKGKLVLKIPDTWKTARPS